MEGRRCQGSHAPAQRGTLENALRVDQAGEVAANWIYKGQMAVLGHDLVAGPLIQESDYLFSPSFLSEIIFLLGYVGAREKASCCHEQIIDAASSKTDHPERCCENWGLRPWRSDGFDGKRSRHGLYRGC